MLTVHRAERAEQLVGALAAVLVEPPADPFTPDVVAVPSRGIERWLAHRLSNVLGASPGRADGVCANVTFPFPARLVGAALQGVTTIDPVADPWDPGRAVWPLLAIVAEHLDDPWMRTLSAHVGGPGGPDDGERRARRFGTARRIADLFDRYAVHRPAMLVRWAAGDDVDGLGAPIPDDLAWEVTLWRLLRDRIGVPSPAERLGPACDRLRDEPELVALPERVAAYGLTRLAPSMLQVLDAVAAARDVHLFLLHPSPTLWDRVGHDASAVADHPLLATWGKDSRELQPAIVHSVGSFADRHHPTAVTPTTLLQRLQHDIGHDVRPPGAPLGDAPDERLLLAPDDDSVQVHSCHGRARQVEVLRDAITHLLADDPTLKARDVIVMCPDIEIFAPLVHATFGPGDPVGEPGGPTRLRVRLADRALRQTNPVLAVLTELLQLATARITAAQLIDFAGREPVRRRFHLDDDDLERIEEWASSAGVRWGLDAAHRAPWQLHQLATNTWDAGLDRILLGVAMTEDDVPLVGDVLPLDDVDSGDIELAGRITELVERVRTAVTMLDGSRPLAQWAVAIATALDALTDCDPRDGWQRAELDRLLAEAVAESDGTTGGATDLTLPEVRSLLGERLRGRPSRANFRTGHLTVCTLVPMRSVPHRVVCLLGLDDGTFPRHGAPDGDDLVLRVHQAGDRDVRNEDRQLLLDAVLAAGDHVIVTFGGRDERTNATVPPSVPVGELLDVIDATARAGSGPARRQVVVEHPLQPFDERNFVAGRLRPGTPWSFDRDALAGARALGAPPRPAAGFLPGGPLPTTGATVVELDDLVRFVEHPTRSFLRRRLGIGPGGDDDEIDDVIPLELDGLARWNVGGRLLDARLAGVDWDRAVAAEVARGLLPPLTLGWSILAGVHDDVEAITAAVAAVPVIGPARSIDVHVHLGPVGTLVGTVAGVRDDCLLHATFSRVAPKHRIAAWVRLLALAASRPGEELTAITIGRGRRGVGRVRLPALRGEDAVAHLRVLLDLHQRGMREPLPLYTKTSEAFVRRTNPRDEWCTGDRAPVPREDLDPGHRRVLGGQVPFEALLAERPRDDESGPGWDEGQPTRFGRYAVRLWQPLVDHEERDGLW